MPPVTPSSAPANGAGHEHFFNGTLDDVRLYSRALTAAEILELTLGGQPTTGVGTQTVTGNPIIAGDLVLAAGTLAAGNTTPQVGGSWMNYGGIFTTGTSGGVTFNGSGTTNEIRAVDQDFNDVTISGTGTWRIYDTITTTVGGDFVQTNGTFVSSSGTLEVKGAFNRSGGTFTHGSGTVLLSSPTSQTFTSGGAVFYNLTINDGLVGYWKMDDASSPSLDSSGWGALRHLVQHPRRFGHDPHGEFSAIPAVWPSTPPRLRGLRRVRRPRSSPWRPGSGRPRPAVAPIKGSSRWGAPRGATAVFINAAGLVAPDNPMSLALTANRLPTSGEWKSPSDSLVYGNWYHIVITYDSTSTSNNPAMYINGVS